MEEQKKAQEEFHTLQQKEQAESEAKKPAFFQKQKKDPSWREQELKAYENL